MTQAEFKFRRGNPDVLTSIANLSNDEVFTPPEFANRMLDTLEEAWATSNGGANIWEDSSVTFLDPFTKSGVFLREITERLTHGLAKEIPDLQERVNHILTKQVFGIGITQLTALLARRSVYCSKIANGEHSIVTTFENQDGNIWFERIEHTWVGGTDKRIVINSDGAEETRTTDAKCKFCGAKRSEYDRGPDAESHAYAFIHTQYPFETLQTIFGAEMKFDVVVGNPPYQLSAGDTSDSPIYQKFVEQALQIEPSFLVMVTPSRWFAGGKGLDAYRKSMIENRHLQVIVDFPDSKDSFPGVEIKGGVSYFLWNKDFEGDCNFSTVVKGEVISQSFRDLRDGQGVLIRDNFASSIVEKVLSRAEDRLSEKVSAQTPFGIHTNFSEWHKSPRPGLIRLFKRGLEEAWVDPKFVTLHKDWISPAKVLISKAYNGGDAIPHQVTGKPVVVEGNSVCTQTYMVAGLFESLDEAENYAQYLSTRFVRFLVRLRKISQDNRPDTFAFVPDLPMDTFWTDEMLYERYGISEHEQDYIASQVKAIDQNSNEEDFDE